MLLSAHHEEQVHAMPRAQRPQHHNQCALQYASELPIACVHPAMATGIHTFIAGIPGGARSGRSFGASARSGFSHTGRAALYPSSSSRSAGQPEPCIVQTTNTIACSHPCSMGFQYSYKLPPCACPKVQHTCAYAHQNKEQQLKKKKSLAYMIPTKMLHGPFSVKTIMSHRVKCSSTYA